MSNDDIRPFNIQKESAEGEWKANGNACTVPWWLAEEAYKVYSKRYGTMQSLERLNERGGFGRREFLGLLRDRYD